MKRMYFVRACWDEDAKVFYSESDIFGLHIETPTIEEFEAIMNEVAVDLIIASAEDIASKPLRDLVPTILWQPPQPVSTAA